jgi:hypothetical protein
LQDEESGDTRTQPETPAETHERADALSVARAMVDAHPLAELFPDMGAADYAALVAGMRASGYDPAHPVVMLDGLILDGRHRYRAATELGIEPPLLPYEGTDPLGFVLRENVTRRHLSESQRGLVAERLATLKHGGTRTPTECKGQIWPLTLAEAAERLNVSRNTVKAARKVREKGAPELVLAVEQGRVSVSAASELVSLAAADQVALATEPDHRERARKVREAKDKTRGTTAGDGPTPYPTESHRRDLPGDGMRHADAAIREMSLIKPNDVQRHMAFLTVRKWLYDHRPRNAARRD